MIRTPRLDEREFERLKAERLNDILQARAEPGRLADERFLRRGLRRRTRRTGASRPGRRRPSERSRSPPRASSTPAATRRAWRTSSSPGRSSRTRRCGAVERRLGDWSGTGRGHRTIEPRQRGGRRIVLVDRPGIGPERAAGRPPRHRPRRRRYFPAMVMAALLGGVFGSRLNRGCARSSATRTERAAPSTRVARPGRSPRPPRSRPRSPPTRSASCSGSSRGSAPTPPAEAELAEVRDFLVGVFPLRFETTSRDRGGDRAARDLRAARRLVAHLPHPGSRRSGRTTSTPRRATSCGPTRRSSC